MINMNREYKDMHIEDAIVKFTNKVEKDKLEFSRLKGVLKNNSPYMKHMKEHIEMCSTILKELNR